MPLPGRTIIFVIAWFMFQVAPVMAQTVAVTDVNRYEITISPDMRVAHVEAVVQVEDGRLFMNPFGVQGLPGGWASWIRNLSARDASGPVVVTEAPDAGWIMDRGRGSEVALSYDVDLVFTREPWPSGNEQAGQLTEDALYLVTRPLLIVAAPDRPSELTFDLPANWSVSAPWRPLGSGGRRFTATDRNDLLSNSFVVGRHREVRVKRGPYQVLLALPGEAGAAADLVRPVLEGALDDYLTLFPETPERTFLMTFFYAPTDDGEAYSSSAAFTSRERLDELGVLIWANFIAHEALHQWNGQMIASSDRPGTAWFREGGTEYFANLALVRSGRIAPRLWLRKAEAHLSLYSLFEASPAWSAVTLQNAGAAPGANRPGVYNGGWAAAFCLDGEIRERSQDRRSLRDLISVLFQRYGLTRTRYAADDIEAVASEMAGESMSTFFSDHITGNTPLRLQQCLARFGLRMVSKPYAGEVYLAVDPSASLQERARLGQLMNHEDAYAALSTAQP